VLADNTERTEYTLEPELISNLFDKNREKRRLVRYEDIPPVLVHAVVSAEDKRFFQHSGFDPIRIVKSAYVDMKQRQNAQGASTLSMQLAGMLFLDRSDRSWRRKIPEVLITMHLEQKLKKEQIFEFYANQVPLGNRGSFGIRGFGGQFSKSLLVLIDGRSVYTPLFAGVYWDVQNVLLDDVERIEVIRGPAERSGARMPVSSSASTVPRTSRAPA